MLKRIEIQAYQVGLVFEKGRLTKVLKEGVYWVMGNKIVYINEMRGTFSAPFELNQLLENKELAELLDVVEVKYNEIALYFYNGLFSRVLTAGTYAFWKGLNKFISVDMSKPVVSTEIPLALLKNGTLSGYVQKYEVADYERGLLLIEGEFVQELAPGTYFYWTQLQSVVVKKVDLRAQQMEIGGQEVLTKDKSTVRINFNVVYRIVNLKRAVMENKDVEKQLYVMLQLILRRLVGSQTLDELLALKDQTAKELYIVAAENAEKMGLQIEDLGIKDIILPGDMREIMNQVLIAEKRAQANTITRREETASVRSMLNTAKLMEENEMLWKLKEMEYVEKIAERIGDISLSGGGNVINQLKELFVK